jgi:hypothetical protein
LTALHSGEGLVATIAWLHGLRVIAGLSVAIVDFNRLGLMLEGRGSDTIRCIRSQAASICFS